VDDGTAPRSEPSLIAPRVVGLVLDPLVPGEPGRRLLGGAAIPTSDPVSPAALDPMLCANAPLLHAIANRAAEVSSAFINLNPPAFGSEGSI
jgi:hypothetical protein